MTGEQFQGIRESLKLKRVAFGRALGYTGEDRNIWKTIQRYEDGQKPVPPMVGRMAWLLGQFHANERIALDPETRLPQWPATSPPESP